jgi:hypothetical protein
MTPLEALAVDYVRLVDKLSSKRESYLGNAHTGKSPTVWGEEANKVMHEISKLEVEKGTILAAIQSYVHAAYAGELNQGKMS